MDNHSKATIVIADGASDRLALMHAHQTALELVRQSRAEHFDIPTSSLQCC